MNQELNTTHASRQRLVVVNKLAATIDFFDATTHQIVKTIKMPRNPHEILLSPDQQTAYISIYGDGVYGNNVHPGHQVVMLDLESMQAVGEIDLGENAAPHGLALDARGLLWVCCDKSASIVLVDPQQRKVVDTISLGTVPTPHWIVIAPNEHKAYTSNKATPYLSVVDTHAHQLLHTISIPTGTEGLALSPDGEQLYVMDHMGSGLPTAVAQQPLLYVIETTTDTILHVVPLEGFSAIPPAEDHETRVRVTPDSRYVVISAYKWNLVAILDAANLSLQKVVSVEQGPMGIAFPPDEPMTQRAYVTNHDASHISVIDVQKAVVVQTFPCGRGAETLECISQG